MRVLFSAICALVALSSSVAVAATSAEDVVKATTQQVIERLQEEKQGVRPDPPDLYIVVKELVLPRFDFARMSRWALGKHWKSLDEVQRQLFSEEFGELLVRAYANVLLEYNDENFAYSPAEPIAHGEFVVVRQEISKPDGSKPLPVDYRMHFADSQWKVVDVVIDGVSLVANYRSAFDSEIRAKGFEGLIQTMQNRNGHGRG